MDHLTWAGGNNMGGVREFRFAPIQHLRNPPDIILGTVDEEMDFRQFAPGESYDWNTGYVTEDTAEFQETETEGPGGTLFIAEFTGFFPGDTAEQRANLDDIVRHYHVVDVTDNNGNLRRMGTLQNPARITTAFSTGRGASNRPGYELRVRWSGRHPVPFCVESSGSGSGSF